MKYIISESRLLSVIHKFLDKKIPNPQVVKGIIYWGEPGNSNLVLDIENKLLLVGQFYIDSVSNVFGISERESISIIKKYFQNKGYEIDRVV